MKKLISLLLMLMLAFSFVSCGDDTPDDEIKPPVVNPGDNPYEGWQGPIVPIQPID